jgi:two-component system, sensor histidine kinase
VHDSGIGIESSIIDKIFDPFSQQDKKMRSVETGMGLNLHLCKKLMSLMNGTIEVSSAINKYTLFTLELPFIEKNTMMEDLQADAGFSASASHKNLPTLPNFKTFVSYKLLVLIVDDNVTNVFVLSSFFNKLKVQYDTAYNGEKAVEAVTRKVYDIIFMDINMPVMNGIVATQKIRSFNREHDRPKQVIYAVTAQKEERVNLLIEGTEFDDIFQKPMSLKLVQQIINQNKLTNGYIQTEPD